MHRPLTGIFASPVGRLSRIREEAGIRTGDLDIGHYLTYYSNRRFFRITSRDPMFGSKQSQQEIPRDPSSGTVINPRTGQLEDRLVGLRIIMIDSMFYKGLRDNLYSRFQSGASLILFEMGVGYGKATANVIKEMGDGILESYSRFMERGKKQGYGEFKVPLLKSILSGMRGEARIYLKNSFFAESAGSTGKTECWIVAGMIAGAARIILKKEELSCVEEKCISKGDPQCEFRLKGL
jgi:predicted hydrocarbon binding protein